MSSNLQQRWSFLCSLFLCIATELTSLAAILPSPTPTTPPDARDVEQRLHRRQAESLCGWYSTRNTDGSESTLAKECPGSICGFDHTRYLFGCCPLPYENKPCTLPASCVAFEDAGSCTQNSSLCSQTSAADTIVCTDPLYPSCFTQKYNSDQIGYYSNFCGHGSTSFPDLAPDYTVPYTNEIPLTDTAGKSVGTTAAVVVKTYSAAGTYASVFPPAQDTSDTDAPPTTTGGSNLTARVIYIVLGVLGLFGLALLLSLRVVAHLARRTRSNSDAFASLPSPHPKSTSSRSGP